jgi:hypothetical protein
MGRLIKQDIDLLLEVLQAMLDSYERELHDANVNREQKRMVIICAAAYVILWAGALRGGEVFLLEYSELVKQRNNGRNKGKEGPCVILLMGHFKQETGERNLILVLANKTKSGLEIRKWIDLLIGLLRAENRHNEVGPAICNVDGFMMESWKLSGEFHEAIKQIQDSVPGLISSAIDVESRYNVYWPFRRGATTRAKEQGVDEVTIEMNNRWRKWQNKQDSMPNLPMSQLYVKITQVLT